MKVITPGHKYRLDDFNQVYGHIPYQEPTGQTLQFINKEPVGPGSTELVTITDGTTNEEVLAMLIDRLQFLQAKFPCRENAIVLTKLQESLFWLNERTAGRKARGVEGQQKI